MTIYIIIAIIKNKPYFKITKMFFCKDKNIGNCKLWKNKDTNVYILGSLFCDRYGDNGVKL